MTLRGAIIGAGNVAIHGHLPGWLARRDVEIVAAADPVAAREADFRARLPRARWYAAVDELWAREALDFVDICTPPATHADLIRAALRQGLHVLCEKPLVCRLEDLHGLAEVAARANRVLYTVHNWHHAPVIRKVCALLGEGAIGEIRRCTWQTLRTQPAGGGETAAGNWRVDSAMAGGGILLDHGWHALYVVPRWLGQAARRISARLETRRYAQWSIEDTATIQLEGETATAEVFLTWASDARANRASVDGTGGTIWVEDDTVALTPSGAGRRGQRWECPPALSNGSYHPDWFGGVASDFVAEVTGGSAARGANLAEAALCATLVGLAQESSRQGGGVLPVPGPSVTAAVAERVAGKAGQGW